MKTVVLNVGHTKLRQGAKHPESGISEYQVNSLLANQVERSLRSKGVIVLIVTNKYVMLPSLINSVNPDLIIAMHCNAFNGSIEGHETLIYNRTNEAKAEIMNSFLNLALQNTSRGVKIVQPTHRGYSLVKKTKAPCLIVEPCFIDNNEDFNNFMHKMPQVVEAYTQGIIECLKLT